MGIPADRVVLTSAILTIGSTTAASVLPVEMGGHGSLPKPRMVIGGALAFAGLSMLADVAPGVAKPLSVVMAFTAMTYYGVPLLNNWFGGIDRNNITPGN